MTGNNSKKLFESPDTWQWSAIGDIAEIITGNTPSKKKPEYYGNYVPLVKPPELLNKPITSAQDNLSAEGAKVARVLPPNSVLVSCIGNLGKTGINSVPVAFNQQINAVEFPDYIIPKFGFYYFQASAVKGRLEELSSATTVAIVNKSKFSTIPFPIPPRPEQERIVTKLEETFTQLEAGVAELQNAKAQLKRYRAAVLKSAVEGRLVNGKSGIGEGELPDGWQWITLSELTKHLTSGSRGWAKYYSDTGSLFVRVGNFNRLSKTIDLEKIVFVNEPEGAEANRTRLQARDLLITMTADVEMVGVVDEKTLHWGNAYINQHVGLVRLEEPNFVDYIAYALASEIGQKQFREKQYGATKWGLNFEDIKSLELPLPPLEEQQRIVQTVERRLSVADEIEKELDESLVRAERLRGSVLKSAFEGRL